MEIGAWRPCCGASASFMKFAAPRVLNMLPLWRAASNRTRRGHKILIQCPASCNF